MTAINIGQFRGEMPRLMLRNLPENAAEVATDVRLDDGGLTAIRKPAIENANFGAYDTIFPFDGGWIGFSGTVHAALGPIATERLYYTGDGAPKMRIGSTIYPLALAAPSTALTASKSGTPSSSDVTTRLYLYTWVTDYGEESAPCPASNEIEWSPGETVSLSGFAATPSGRNITKQRIYRAQTGSSGTYYYLIAERSASNSNYSDTVGVDGFQDPLPSMDFNPPSDTLAGLTAMANGMMAAFDGNTLYFCEPYQPHAWPEKYALYTDAPIVGLAFINATLIVLTEGSPYAVSGSAPESMQMTELEADAPCLSARSIVDLGNAVGWVSAEGLMVLDGGGVRNATAGVFNYDTWQQYDLASSFGCQMHGRYVFFWRKEVSSGVYDYGTMLFDLATGATDKVNLSVIARAAHYQASEAQLRVIERSTNDLLLVDPLNTARKFLYWRSKEFVLPTAETFAAIRIDTDELEDRDSSRLIQAEVVALQTANAALITSTDMGAINSFEINGDEINGDPLDPLPLAIRGLSGRSTVVVYADREILHSFNPDGGIKRIPPKRSRRWQISIYTDKRIERIAMATSVSELKALV